MVKIIECKDCKHIRIRPLDDKKYCWITAMSVNDNDFCSRAVEKENVVCKDCKHYVKGKCKKLATKTKENFYCTWAERKEP